MYFSDDSSKLLIAMAKCVSFHLIVAILISSKTKSRHRTEMHTTEMPTTIPAKEYNLSVEEEEEE